MGFRVLVAGCSLLGGVVLAAGCHAASEDSRAQAAAAPAASPARAVLDKAAATAFTPPADGRIRDAQLDLYLAVEARAAEIRQAITDEKPADPDAAYDRFTLAEVTAAGELGVDPREFEWVHDRVLEARMAELSLALLQKTEAGRQDFLATLQRDMRSAQDPARITELGRRIREIKLSAAESQAAVTAAIRANIETLSTHQAEIERYAALARPAADPSPAAVTPTREEPAVVRTPR